MREPFLFGIPLIARASAADWSTVERLLELTLRSVLAQDDPDFRVILAAHNTPGCWSRVAHDPRFELVRADWGPEPPSPANDDGGRKKWLVKNHVRRAGGGLVMFLDADDWIARDLVRISRASIGPGHVGGLVACGFALDWRSGRVAPLPSAGVLDHAVHRVCGSTTVGRVDPASADPVRADPHAALGSHNEWRERADRNGWPLASLETEVVYVLGTGQNHSEAQGPFADWRAGLTRAVRARGRPLDAAFAARFGQEMGAIFREIAAPSSPSKSCRSWDAP